MPRPVTLFTGQWADLPLIQLAKKATEWGFDGLELASWGDHFDVAAALAEPAYCRRSILASHLEFGEPDRGWDFVSPGHGDVDFDEVFRALNRSGYDGPLSVEWEDSGMDREWGARDAVAFVRRNDFAPSQESFDAAFAREGNHG